MNTVTTFHIGPVPSQPDSALPAVLLALTLALIASAVAVAGVYLVFGLGWACIAGSVPLFAIAAVILRGLKHGA